VQHLGWKIAAGINAAAPLAPTGLAAAVLLSHDRRALSETELLDRAEFLHMAAVDNGAHGGTEPIRPLVLNAVESLCADGTLKRHEAGAERFYAVPEERRIALDYTRTASSTSWSRRRSSPQRCGRSAAKPAPHAELLRPRARRVPPPQVRVHLSAGKESGVHGRRTFALLLRWGLVERVGDAVQPVAAGLRMLSLLAELLRPFGETVWAAADSLELLLGNPMPAREWTQKTLDGAGRRTSPGASSGWKRSPNPPGERGADVPRRGWWWDRSSSSPRSGPPREDRVPRHEADLFLR